MTLSIESEALAFDGRQIVFCHESESLTCPMKGAIYLPPQARERAVPVVYFLSGLTCTEQNVITKAGAQRLCSKLGIAFVCPDTSPRGDDVPDSDDYDLGQGAGFYVNATQSPWSTHYRMYDYVLDEVPRLIEQNFAVTQQRSIMGHSMGGHGALMIALRNPGRYRSVSAFSPVGSPSQVPWGKKAFSAYLGEEKEDWAKYDSTHLLESGARFDSTALIDVGTSDPFYEEQLKPEILERAATRAGQRLTLRRQEGYDHSYYFIATFMSDHLSHHGRALGVSPAP